MSMDGWDVALIAVAGYVAVTALARLMVQRRNELMEQFHAQMKAADKKLGEAATGSKEPPDRQKAA